MDAEDRPSSAPDDVALLSQLEAINPEVAQRFLEHLVLTRNNTVRGVSFNIISFSPPIQDADLHSQLANLCVDRLISALKNEEVYDFFRDSGSCRFILLTNRFL